MLIFLLLFEIGIIFIIVLSHVMLEKKYREVEKSIQIYTSKRAYRTKQSIAFIDDIIKRHVEFVEQKNELPDLYSMIKSSLLREYIGKFTFIGVNNIAHKGKYIMWGIIVLEMTIGCINNVAISLEGIVVIISSILLAIGVETFVIIKALEEKKEATIVLVEDYILNAYPLEANKQTKTNNAKEQKFLEEGQAKQLILLTETQNKISYSVVPENKKNNKREKEVSSGKSNLKEGLKEEDIIRFITNLNNL